MTGRTCTCRACTGTPGAVEIDHAYDPDDALAYWEHQTTSRAVTRAYWLMAVARHYIDTDRLALSALRREQALMLRSIAPAEFDEMADELGYGALR